MLQPKILHEMYVDPVKLFWIAIRPYVCTNVCTRPQTQRLWTLLFVNQHIPMK